MLKIHTEPTMVKVLLLKDSISSALKLSATKVLSFLSALLMSGGKTRFSGCPKRSVANYS